jgi:glycosyltransferase involved in cell wall biosynthesis
MRVAFVTHQLPDGREDHGPGLLRGRYAGGAEMSTEELLAQAPDDFEVTVFRPEFGMPDAGQFDRVVVGATERLSDDDMAYLASCKPVVWVRSPQTRNAARLLSAASVLVMPSPEMVAWHEWVGRDMLVCPAPMDTSLIPRGVQKEKFALWAGRDHPLKGKWDAVAWAMEADLKIVTLTNQPREVVLEHMGRASVFVHLPHNHDPCPRTVIEAEIAGCEIVVNENVGRVPVRGADEVAEYVEGAAGRFWEWVRAS